MKKPDTSTTIRTGSSRPDPSVLISPVELASLITAPTVGKVYAAPTRGKLSGPIVQASKRIRWGVGQIRRDIKGLKDALQFGQR